MVTIDKAIKVNQELLDGEYDHRDETMEEALKLGIEALKCVIEDEYRGTEVPRPLLPGETKE